MGRGPGQEGEMTSGVWAERVEVGGRWRWRRGEGGRCALEVGWGKEEGGEREEGEERLSLVE